MYFCQLVFALLVLCVVVLVVDFVLNLDFVGVMLTEIAVRKLLLSGPEICCF